MSDPHDLLGRFVNPGDLVFDIGANEGKHTAWLLDLGARVIAVEPQPDIAARISPHPNLLVVVAAVSDQQGTTSLYVSPGHEYVTTTEPGYLDKVQRHATYPYLPPVLVETVTLDGLITEYGVPAFCKIDVEGHERAVLHGLTRPLKALSFEVHDFDPDKPGECIARLEQLGRYEYFFCGRESFIPEPWPAEVDIFGDIYAVLQ